MSQATIREKFLPEFISSNSFKELYNMIVEHKKLSVKGMVGSSYILLLSKFFLARNENVLLLLNDKEECLYATTELEEILGKDHVLYFPPSYLDPYQLEKVQNANLVLRTEVLKQLSGNNSPKVIVAPFQALSEKVLKQSDLGAITRKFKIGDKVQEDIAVLFSEKFHLNRVDFVSGPGEYSLRGGIIDVFSYASTEPFRLTLFGNEIETIRKFDIESQLSKDKVVEFQLISNMNLEVKHVKVPFLDFLSSKCTIFSRDSALGVKKLEEFFEKAEEVFLGLSKELKRQMPNELFLSSEEFLVNLKRYHHCDLSMMGFLEYPVIEVSQRPQPQFHKKFDFLAQDLLEKQSQGYDTWISFSSEKQKERLASILDEMSPDLVFRSFISELHEGFIDSNEKLLVYTDHQIFDRYQRFKTKNSFARSEQITLKDMMSLKIGDYITHVDHGVGKFLGLVKINNNGKVQECFKLSYKNQDLLYVSIHALHKISKYTGPEGKAVVLSKLGSPAWKSLKQKTKAKVKQLAFDLITLYAERKSMKGFAFSPDSYLQHELEASFLYEDTPDQERATIDVKKDMESDQIMDRLICGDVGFGKTEIAMRAAFKAATDGKQVAVLVPTTILAFQHYRSFVERFSDFPVTISYLNRFRSTAQKNQTKQGLKDGKIDIVIGTHQLVGKDIEFKDLGLLIIDEEHKFGVNVKDKLKTFKKSIDTLTLTATPIPRTLQFSLMAARDLSVIKTPPPNRQPVETKSIDFDEELIRDAVAYEISRDGQVYFINNRIENLKEIAGLIQRLVPEARVITGHGQMEGKALEKNVLDFMDGKYDVLVSTTIVESGVDVPNANTIFINDAQKFGMADLHQMRGRVGRGNRKAFCYLITPSMDLISTDARKRLEAIEQFSDLGSGFQIAMKDLEIRGAGDLLGAEQSGFINEMGFETYQKIMQEALEELQQDVAFENLFENEDQRRKLIGGTKDVNIDTDLEMMLPDSYVQSTEERLLLYQKLSEISDEDTLKEFKSGLIDRFGELPFQAINLLKSIELKWLAGDIGFEKIVVKNGVFLGYFPSNPQDKFYSSEKFQHIIGYLSRNPQDAILKEKHTKDGSQLMMRKENVGNVEEVNLVLERILKA